MRRAVVAMALERLLLHDAQNEGSLDLAHFNRVLLYIEEHLARDQCAGAALRVQVEQDGRGLDDEVERCGGWWGIVVLEYPRQRKRKREAALPLGRNLRSRTVFA